VKPKP